MHRASTTPHRHAPVAALVTLAITLAGTLAATATALAPAALAVTAYPGTLTFLAGTGTAGPASASGTAALSSKVNYPRHLVAAPDGSLYLADSINRRVEKVDPSGTMTYIAGTGAQGVPADTGTATAQPLGAPYGLALDSSGDTLYVADYANNAVRKIDLSRGIMTRIAGSSTGAAGAGSGGPATSQLLNAPDGLALAPDGTLFIADSGNNRVVKIDPSGSLSIVAGTGAQATAAPTGGPATTQVLNTPHGVGLDGAGNLYIADTRNNVVEKVDPTGQLSIIAGTGVPASSPATPGPATSAALNSPYAIAVDSAGNLWISDTRSHQVELVAPNGQLTVVAGTGVQAAAVNGVPATSSPIGSPWGVTLDPRGTALYVSDSTSQRVLSITRPPAATVPSITSPAPGASGSSPSSSSGVGAGSGTATAGSAYSWTPTASGSTSTWSITAGALPPGLSLNTSTGAITGTPTTPGTSTFTVQVSTSAGYDTQTGSITVVAPPPPSAPQAVTTVPGDASVVLTWSPPASAGAAPVTSYSVTLSPAVAAPSASCTTTTLTCTLTGLTNGTTYTAAVVATSSAGTSPAGGSAPFTPAATPGPSSAQGAGGQLAQRITTTAPSWVPLTSRTLALGASSWATTPTGATIPGGVLSYSTAASPTTTASAVGLICTVDSTGLITATASGECPVVITAAATPMLASASMLITTTITAPPIPSLNGVPGGSGQSGATSRTLRIAGADRIGTAAGIAGQLFPDPPTTQDVVLASADSFADALTGARLAGQIGAPLLLTSPQELDGAPADQLRRLLAGGGTLYVLGQTNAVSAAVQAQAAALLPRATIRRVGGPDRYATAAAIADIVIARGGDVGPIYLATGLNFPDAVTADAAAQVSGGVLLLTSGATLPASTATWLNAHDPHDTRALPVGGPALSATTTTGRSGAAQRALSGADRYATAASLAGQVLAQRAAQQAAQQAARLAGAHGQSPAPGGTASPSSSTTPSNALRIAGIAGGDSWADALPAASAMAALGGPLLLTPTGQDTVSTSTVGALESLGATLRLVFGGQSSITPNAFTTIQQMP